MFPGHTLHFISTFGRKVILWDYVVVLVDCLWHGNSITCLLCRSNLTRLCYNEREDVGKVQVQGVSSG